MDKYSLWCFGGWVSTALQASERPAHAHTEAATRDQGSQGDIASFLRDKAKKVLEVLLS